MTLGHHPFPVHTLGLAARIPVVEPEGNFWAVVRSALKDQDLSALSEPEVTGQRVWLLLPGQGGVEAGAMGGLALARSLAARGRCTILLDAQENENSLTRQCGRLFRSGWLDMARYGTSLASAALTVDWDGRQGYFLGLGSYCPAEISSAEIQVLMSRVAGQVDDIIVVCGTGPEVLPWAEVAESYLYCWDRASESSAHRDATIKEFEGLDISCEGVLALGLVEDSSLAADEKPKDTEGVGATLDEPVVEPVETHSSNVFRLVAFIGLLGVSALALFIWKFTEFGQEPSIPEPLFPAQRQETVVAVPADTQFALEAVDDSAPLLAMAPDSLPAPRDSVPAASSVATVNDSLEVQEPRVTVAEPDPASAWQKVAPAFATPVGEQGWCLHVYSLRDSVAAQREIQFVQRRGLQAVMAPVVLPDSTQWFRVYVGDFSSRAAATEAEPALKWKLKTDWARPTVLKGSARN